MKLSIIIPAYNEEKRIVPTLESYINFFEKNYNKDFEVIVSINGSTDNTLNIVESYKDIFPQIKIVNIKEKGKGLAIKEGFRIAEGELIGYVDADNSSKPEEFNKLIDGMSNYILSFNCLMGSRYVKGSEVIIKQPLSRRIASRIFNFFVRNLFGFQLKDTQSGCKIFNKEAVKDIVNDLKMDNWAFDVELLSLLKKKGYVIGEIPIKWDNSLGSNLRLRKAVPEMFISIMKLRFGR